MADQSIRFHTRAPRAGEIEAPFVARRGKLDFHQFDLYSQALSKVERGFAQDLEDVSEMAARGFVSSRQVRELYARIEPDLFRYPAIDRPTFRAKVERAFS